MKKTLLALAVLGTFSGIASAQSSVSVYGIVDAGIVNERGGAAGSVTKLTSGVGSASRIGFKGTEDLGGGLSANFVLESGYRVDTGELDNSSSRLFNRQSYVGLKGGFGTVNFGRQYTPYYLTLSSVADPFGAGYAGSAKNLFPTVDTNTRNSNAIVYSSPNVAGFTGDLFYSLGEQAGSNSAGRQVGAAVGYANGPLNVRLAYNNRNTDVVVPAASNNISTNTLLAANYDFRVAKAFLAYGLNKGPVSAVVPNQTNPFTGTAAANSTDSRDVLVGVSVPFGASTVMASYIRKDDKTSFDQDADQYAIGYTYALSKRTNFYSSYAYIKNKNGAGYTVGNNTEVGTGNKAFNLGVRHSF